MNTKPALQPLDDDSPMPFGKFRGDRMEDVPASYLHWFWVTRLHRAQPDPA